jgi:hypothetical protein
MALNFEPNSLKVVMGAKKVLGQHKQAENQKLKLVLELLSQPKAATEAILHIGCHIVPSTVYKNLPERERERGGGAIVKFPRKTLKGDSLKW